MQLTQDSSDYINKEAIGYLLNIGLSRAGQDQVLAVQDKLLNAFGDKIWCAPVGTLHITLMDWLAPLVNYHEDKDVLFEELEPSYDESLNNSIAGVRQFTVRFEKIQVSPSAVFCIGQDDGQMNKIRELFLQKVDLLGGTKPPPEIVHFSIARFMAELKIADIEKVLEDCSLNITEHIKSFRLIRETKLPMQEYKILQEYPLNM